MDTAPLTAAPARETRHRVRISPRGRALAIFSAVVVIVFAALPFFGSLNLISLLTQGLVYGALAVTLDVVWGYGGILDLGHGIWFGLGALGVGVASTTVSSSGQVLSVDGGLGSHLLGLLLGIAGAAILATAVSLVAFSGRGQTVFYIGVLTLALSVIAGTLLLQFESVTGGEAGLYGFGLAGLSQVAGYWLSLGVLVVFAGLAFVVIRSDFGVLLRSVRDQESRVSFFGYRVWQIKTLTFVGGAVFAAIAGAVYGSVIGLVSPPLFDFLMATNIVIWVAIGGRASIFGPIVGAIVITSATNQLNAASPELWELIVGVIFVVVIVFLPRGLIAPLAQLLDRVPGMRSRTGSEPDRVLTASAPESRFDSDGRPLVSLKGFSFGYGSRAILTDLDLDVHPGELLAIVGPNGAGKSTLLTALSDGRLRYRGEVTFTYTPTTHAGTPPHELLKAGLARKFQTPDLFPTLTVAETIMLAARRGRFPSMWRRSRIIQVPASVLEVVSAMGLDDHLDTPAGLLAHGLRQGLEMAAMIATNPRVLLLDEPTAGLTSAERELVGSILTALVRKSGIAVVLIEHDLDFVKQIADRVAVLARGTVLQIGTSAEVSESALVRDIYTGEAAL